MTMLPTYLIQRLCAPKEKDNPYSFGGGYKNGGLTDEAMGIVRTIWSFDYMGAAEYEFGRVPEALRGMYGKAQSGELATSIIEACGLPIYIIGARKDLLEISERVKSLAKTDKLPGGKWTRDYVGLQQVLQKQTERDFRGWLELDNGFLFFVDAVMFGKAAKMFGKL
jgi:hypothetical protein